MCIDRASETIMTKGITRDASRAEVFRRKHAPRGHYSHKGVERGLLWVLLSHQRAGMKCAGEPKSMSVSEIACKSPGVGVINFFFYCSVPAAPRG